MNSFVSAQTLTTLPFPPAKDDLYSRVLDAILEQRIHEASRFTEESLAQMFDARRSDIRGVLTRLSHQQIIISRVNHRPRVASLGVDQVRQTLHARRLTELMLARLTCQKPCTHAIKRLRTLVDSERRCSERGQGIRLSGEFHLQLAEMAGNAPLAHFLGSLVPLTSLAIAQFDACVEDNCGWQLHEKIVDAITHMDTAMAVALLDRHLDHLEAALLSARPLPRQNRIAG